MKIPGEQIRILPGVRKTRSYRHVRGGSYQRFVEMRKYGKAAEFAFRMRIQCFNFVWNGDTNLINGLFLLLCTAWKIKTSGNNYYK